MNPPLCFYGYAALFSPLPEDLVRSALEVFSGLAETDAETPQPQVNLR